MEKARTPLNGEKTHPLSAHAIGVLRALAKAPVAAYGVNPGVRNRFDREGLTREIMKPVRSGAVSAHLRCLEITDAGRAALAALDEAP